MPRKKQPAAGMVYEPGSRCPNINGPKRWMRYGKSLRVATSEKLRAYIANGEKHYKTLLLLRSFLIMDVFILYRLKHFYPFAFKLAEVLANMFFHLFSAF